MTTTLAIQGVCDPRFETVKEAFAQNFADYGEVGAAVAVTVGGRLVVDLWAGHADAALSRPWQQDTIVNVFSTTKGISAPIGLPTRACSTSTPPLPGTGRSSHRLARRISPSATFSATAPASLRCARCCRRGRLTTGSA